MTSKHYNKHDWELAARKLIRVEMARQDVDYGELSKRMTAMGIPNVTAKNLTTKINRGTFPAFFLMQVLIALKCDQVDLKKLPIPF